MRHYLHAKLCRHEQDGNDFIQPAETAGIDLADVDCAGLEKLFEHHTVLAHLAGSDSDSEGSGSLSYSCMTKDVGGRSRLLNKPRFLLGQLFHPVDSFWYGPDLTELATHNE